jgi:hypothetical protein
MDLVCRSALAGRAVRWLCAAALCLVPAGTLLADPAGAAVTTAGTVFPESDLFRPLVADPRQPQFFVDAYKFDSSVQRYTTASVGYGETFGFYRSPGPGPGDGLQIGAAGGLFAQFNLDTPSRDLVNADYTIGIPVTIRSGIHSLRFRLYHQSSHLGDEYLLSVHPQRINLSFESLEALYAVDIGLWRYYGGGEYLVHKQPSDLKPASAHWGTEYRSPNPVVGGGRFLAGLDVHSFAEHKWSFDTSIIAGLEFEPRGPQGRNLRLLAKWYKGYDPRGQFYENKVEYYGLGVSLGF